MYTFEYTNCAQNEEDYNSTAVDGLYYNNQTRALAIDWNDEVYVYDGVPQPVYDALVASDSVGSGAQVVKRAYGPGTHIGNYDAIDFKNLNDEVTIDQAVSNGGGDEIDLNAQNLEFINALIRQTLALGLVPTVTLTWSNPA